MNNGRFLGSLESEEFESLGQFVLFYGTTYWAFFESGGQFVGFDGGESGTDVTWVIVF